MKRILCSSLVVLLLLVFTACGQTGSPPSSASVASLPTLEGVPASSGAEIAGAVVTDQAGRQVTVGGDVQRIVSCYYISSSACIALGIGDKLVGIEAKADTRPIYQLAAPELLDLPNVGSAKEFNMEACIELEPDLVILPKRLQDNAETMAGLGIPVLLVNPENQQGLAEMISLIGEATGTQEAAAKLTDYYKGQMDEVASLTSGISEKPVVYMGGNSAYLSTAPKDMYQASLISAAGGVNAGEGIEGNSWTDVSYEQLLEMAPDVFVIPAEAAYTKEDVLNDPQLAALPAVAGGQVYQMPTAFEAWDSPVPSCTLGVKWLLAVLHEDVYTMDEMRQDAANFYTDFYGVSIDTGQITK